MHEHEHRTVVTSDSGVGLMGLLVVLLLLVLALLFLIMFGAPILRQFNIIIQPQPPPPIINPPQPQPPGQPPAQPPPKPYALINPWAPLGTAAS